MLIWPPWLTRAKSLELAIPVKVSTSSSWSIPTCSKLGLAVLKRDGTSVVTDSACASTSGHWVSPYDNVATTLASDLDIVRFKDSPLNYSI